MTTPDVMGPHKGAGIQALVGAEGSVSGGIWRLKIGILTQSSLYAGEIWRGEPGGR